MTTTVLILGSAPDAKVYDADYIYCANAAAALYAAELSALESQVITIASASELVPSRRNSAEKIAWLRQKRSKILSSITGHLIVYGAENYPDFDYDDVNFSKPGTQFKYEESFNELCEALTKRNVPIFCKKHFSWNIKITVHTIKLFFYSWISRRLNRGSSVHPLFRQGTGINCLLHAISVHDDGASYIVSGISFEDRSIYNDGWKNTWTPSNFINRNHLIVDRCILGILSKKYNIYLDRGVK